jgi:hypothetical protein
MSTNRFSTHGGEFVCRSERIKCIEGEIMCKVHFLSPLFYFSCPICIVGWRRMDNTTVISGYAKTFTCPFGVIVIHFSRPFTRPRTKVGLVATNKLGR